jgi:hypothetical protein
MASSRVRLGDPIACPRYLRPPEDVGLRPEGAPLIASGRPGEALASGKLMARGPGEIDRDESRREQGSSGGNRPMFRWFSLVDRSMREAARSGAIASTLVRGTLFLERRRDSNPRPPPWQRSWGGPSDLRRRPDLNREQGVLVPIQGHRFASFPGR